MILNCEKKAETASITHNNVVAFKKGFIFTENLFLFMTLYKEVNIISMKYADNKSILLLIASKYLNGRKKTGKKYRKKILI